VTYHELYLDTGPTQTAEPRTIPNPASSPIVTSPFRDEDDPESRSLLTILPPDAEMQVLRPGTAKLGLCMRAGRQTELRYEHAKVTSNVGQPWSRV
jgi:hypothetical protein